MTEQQMLDEIEKWLRSQDSAITTLDLDTDLVETGLVTSLKIVELTFLIGRLTGRTIDLEGLRLEQFRTLRNISEGFLRHQENAP
ncbi:hypothetical protein OHR68_36035 [Spirillospora sp. NBC_00431]